MTEANKSKTFPLFPGAETQEGKDRINKAVDAMNDNASLCRVILRDIVDLINDEIHSAEELELVNEAKKALKQWQSCSSELLDAMSGRNN